MSSPIPSFRPLRITSNSNPLIAARLAYNAVTPEVARRGIVWAKENFISSGGATCEIDLLALPDGVRNLAGQWAHVRGKKDLDGNFLRPPFTTADRSVTDDAFDQVQCYYAITSLAIYLEKLGFDMKKILGKWRPIMADANAVDDLNAWFNPRTGRITFGTSNGKWHLASDSDIVRHETGHLILDCIAPAIASWYASDGGAIHEGFADMSAALFMDDSQVSEDFPAHTGQKYGPDMGLRDTNNAIRYDSVDDEVHARGEVYGGLMWGVRTAIAELLDDSRAACDITYSIMMEHGYHYKTNRPTPRDFLEAFLLGAKLYFENREPSPLTYERFEKIVTAEAERHAIPMAKGANVRAPSRGLVRLLMDRDDPFTFKEKSSSQGMYGGRDHLQQFLTLKSGQDVKMLGSGLILFTSPEGVITGYSGKDVRRSVDIDDTIEVTPTEALAVARRGAAQRLEMIDQSVYQTQTMMGAAVSGVDERRRAELRQMMVERRTDRLANDAAINAIPELAELTIMPEGYYSRTLSQDGLHWRFKLGLSDYFIDARTGALDVQRMPMW